MLRDSLARIRDERSTVHKLSAMGLYFGCPPENFAELFCAQLVGFCIVDIDGRWG